MIQRIQSLYLFFSALLVSLAIVFPLTTFSTIAETCQLSAFAVKGNAASGTEAVTLWSLGILFVATAVLTFSAIFFFKKRRLQIKLTRYAFLMKIAIVAVVVYYSFCLKEVATSFSLGLGSLFVPIAMVLDWLAVKAIRKDEELVRSIDRIR